MKKQIGMILLAGVLSSLPVLAKEFSAEDIERMVEKIQLKRVSKIDIDFAKISSPFAKVVQETNSTAPKIVEPEEKVELKLGAIMNDAAYINGKWLHVGDIIEQYKVESITATQVLLKKGPRDITLFLNKDSKLLQISKG